MLRSIVYDKLRNKSLNKKLESLRRVEGKNLIDKSKAFILLSLTDKKVDLVTFMNYPEYLELQTAFYKLTEHMIKNMEV